MKWIGARLENRIVGAGRDATKESGPLNEVAKGDLCPVQRAKC
jgi:hypothetical protein